MNVSLVVWKVVVTDSKIYHTGVEEGTAFIATAITVRWGGWLDLRSFW